MPVAYGISIDDLSLSHILSDFPRLVLIDEVREGPVLGGYLAVRGLSRDERRGHPLELVIEWLIVQENPVIMKFPVEAILNLPDRLHNLPKIRVAGQRHERRIHALARNNCWRQPASIVGRCTGFRIP